MQLHQTPPPQYTEALTPRAISPLGTLSWIAALTPSGIFHATLQPPFPGSSSLPIPPPFVLNFLPPETVFAASPPLNRVAERSWELLREAERYLCQHRLPQLQVRCRGALNLDSSPATKGCQGLVDLGGDRVLGRERELLPDCAPLTEQLRIAPYL